MDRIVDLQFGSGEAAYHVILELYDRVRLSVKSMVSSIKHECTVDSLFFASTKFHDPVVSNHKNMKIANAEFLTLSLIVLNSHNIPGDNEIL